MFVVSRISYIAIAPIEIEINRKTDKESKDVRIEEGPYRFRILELPQRVRESFYNVSVIRSILGMYIYTSSSAHMYADSRLVDIDFKYRLGRE